jgi:hypothetical protein
MPGKSGAKTEADLQLVERVRTGDAAALETHMDRYASRVYRLAHGITRNEADAEEVVQDVFLRQSRIQAIHHVRVAARKRMKAILRKFLLEQLAKEKS